MFYDEFFGGERLQHPAGNEYSYDEEKSCYLINGGLDFGGPCNIFLEKVEKNSDDTISIYIRVYLNMDAPGFFTGEGTPDNYYCITVKDNDDGQTWRYISGKEYFTGEESETTPADDPIDETPEN